MTNVKSNLLSSQLAVVLAGQGHSALAGLKGKSTALPSAAAIAHAACSKCLLLDVSGSMAEEIEPGRSKWDALRALLPQFATTPMYAFNSTCLRCVPSTLPRPRCTTDMAGAFRHVRQASAGTLHVVLVTDGLPDDEDDAPRAAHALTVDIFYVGPDPRPVFLDRLAASNGGTAHSANLSSPKQIVAPIRALLEGPK